MHNLERLPTASPLRPDDADTAPIPKPAFLRLVFAPQLVPCPGHAAMRDGVPIRVNDVVQSHDAKPATQGQPEISLHTSIPVIRIDEYGIVLPTQTCRS